MSLRKHKRIKYREAANRPIRYRLKGDVTLQSIFDKLPNKLCMRHIIEVHSDVVSDSATIFRAKTSKDKHIIIVPAKGMSFTDH